MSSDAKEPFDVRKHLIRVQGNREYLPVAARLIWFREEHPDWGIATKPVEISIEKGYAVFTATITDAEGRTISSGTKMENTRGFPDFLEKAECVPLDSEILTATGWKHYDELELGEPVLAYDQAEDICKWSPLLRVVTYKDQPLLRLHNLRGFDFRCTPEHTWAVTYGSGTNPKYTYNRMVEANKLRGGRAIINSAPAPDGRLEVTPKQAAIMGWAICDGSFKHCQTPGRLSMNIRQSKPPTVAVLDKLLAGMTTRVAEEDGYDRTFPGGSTYHCQPSKRYYLRAGYCHDLLAAFGITHEEELPKVVAGLSFVAREAMLEAMMLADGDKKGTFGKKRRPWVMEVYQILATLQGKSVASWREEGRIIPTQRLKKCRCTYSEGLHPIEDAGRGDVWCPTTLYGTWVMRQGHYISITGNTGSIGRALAAAGYGTQFAPELEEGERLADSPQAPRGSGSKPPSPAGGGGVGFKCSKCGGAVTKAVHDATVKAFKQALCPKCKDEVAKPTGS